MRKVIFNATSLNDKPNGLSLYCKNILERINPELLEEVVITSRYEGLKEQNYCVEKVDIESKNKLVSVFKRNFNYGRYIKKKENREEVLIYSPTQHGLNIKGISQILTIHDLIPLYYPKGRIHQYLYYRFILPRAIKNSKKVITVSNNTKKDIVDFYKVEEDKVEVIYNGFDEGSAIDIEKSSQEIYNHFNIKNYILMVGINYHYKNLHSVIDAFSNIKDKTDLNLVVAGNADNGYGKELINKVEELGLGNRVFFIGYIPDELKNSLYQAAEMFVYPSLYEGFGLPILEAMSNGVPVICSNTSSLPEVGGDAAIYIDSTDIHQIEKSIIRVLEMSADERKILIYKGFERCKEFSWDKCAENVETILKAYL